VGRKDTRFVFVLPNAVESFLKKYFGQPGNSLFAFE